MDTTAYLYNDKTIQPWKHPPVPCTEIQINKSLNLLGIRSWDELEPGRKFIGTEIDKCWSKTNFHSVPNVISFVTISFPVNGDGGDIIYIKEKLDKALKGKLSKIDKQCQRETVEIWRVNMTAKRLEKETYERKIQEEAAVKQRAKTAMRQKVELHEAYQLLLQEHHIRVKRRARQKLLAIGLMKNSTLITSQPEDSTMQEKNDLKRSESYGTNFQTNSESKIGNVRIAIHWCKRNI